VSATGRGAKREGLDFYSTPAWATDAILDVLLPAGGPWTKSPPRVLEPAAGEGHIIERMTARGVHTSSILAVELQSGRVLTCYQRTGVRPIAGDFTETRLREQFELIITNPPFAQAEAFATRALTLLAPGGVLALLLRLNWLGSLARVPFHRAHPADLYILPRRPAFGGAKGTDATEYAWFVWGADRGGRWSLLRAPG